MGRKILMTGKNAQYIENRAANSQPDNDREILMSGEEAVYQENVYGQSAPTEQLVETGIVKQKEVDWDLVGKAVKDCMSYFWGHAAFATIFCICRDEYGFPDNASGFEHKMNEMNIECPKGTIANAIRNNPFMKKPINKWEKDNANPRIHKLIEVFRESVKSYLNDNETT